MREFQQAVPCCNDAMAGRACNGALLRLDAEQAQSGSGRDSLVLVLHDECLVVPASAGKRDGHRQAGWGGMYDEAIRFRNIATDILGSTVLKNLAASRAVSHLWPLSRHICGRGQAAQPRQLQPSGRFLQGPANWHL